MSSELYRMPPLPDKKEYLKHLLTGPHAFELFLDGTGKPVVAVMIAEQVSEHETRLYQQFLHVAAQAAHDSLSQASYPIMREASPKPAVYHLKPDVVVDLTHFVVQRGNEVIALRAREAVLLDLLLRHPRSYVSATTLADAIGFESIEAPAHCVEETVSQVRRKLGETPFRPTLIRCKRYAGYGIFPEEARPQSPVTPYNQTK